MKRSLLLPFQHLRSDYLADNHYFRRNKQMIIKKYLEHFCCYLCVLLLVSQVNGQINSCKSFDFNLAPSYYAGQNTLAYTSADFNIDGNLDIAQINPELKTVSVLLGDEAGGFSPPQTFPSEINPYSITSGDLNSDGKSDLIVGSFNENKIAVLLNNGNGGFLAPTIIAPPNQFPNQGQYYELKAADFNGDGKVDVATIQNQINKQLKIFLGNGQANLTLTATLNLPGDDPKIAVGNINDDNLPDVVVSTGSSTVARSISFVFGQQGGNFSLTHGFTVIDKPTRIRIADLNNDNKSDISIAFEGLSTPTKHSLQPWLNSGNTIFTAGAVIDLTYRFPPTDITTGDFNGDGKQDLAASLSSNYLPGIMVMVINGAGDGTFQNPSYWTVPDGSKWIHAADVNHDSKQDLLAIGAVSSAFNYVSKLINNNYNGFLAPKTIPEGVTDTIRPQYNSEQRTDMVAADFNNDRLLDMVTAPTSDFSTTGEFVIALNDGNKGFLTDHRFSAPTGLQTLETGDFNGDGNQDIVTGSYNSGKQLAVYLGDGRGNLTETSHFSWYNAVRRIVAGDFNGDGKDDIFFVDGVAGSVLLSQGNGNFSQVQGFSIGFNGLIHYFAKPLTGDFNRDGKLDLAISTRTGLNSSTTEIKIWLGVGNGTFTQSASQPLTYINGSAAAGDFNGDGYLDVAALGYNDTNTLITKAFGNGNGGFYSSFTQTINAGYSILLVSGDFNSDSLFDLAFVTSAGGGSLVVIPSLAESPFADSPIYFPVGGLALPYASFYSALVAADYNGDNKIDIGFTGRFQSSGVIYNTSGEKPCLSISDVNIAEDDSGIDTAEFTVHLSQPSSQIVRVNYSLVAGLVSVGSDLESVSGRLIIPAGQRSAVIKVPVKGDLLDEFDEDFRVILSSPENAVLLRSVGNGKIIDNDAQPTLSIKDVSAIEGTGTGQQYLFTVTLSAPSGKPISLKVMTEDVTATGGRDFTAVNNTFNIAPGTASANISVDVYGENTYEPDETFIVKITDPVNVTITDNQAVGTIINDDSIPTLSVTANNVLEGDSVNRNVTVNIRLSNPTYLPVTANYATADGTATAGKDYVASSGTISIPAGQQSVLPIQIQVIGDTIKEANEVFYINLSGIINSNPGNVQAQVVIFDNESVSNDFDGDGKSDVSVFRPESGVWHLLKSQSGYAAAQFGLSIDKLVPADYDGDRKTDLAVFRENPNEPGKAKFFILQSSNNQFREVQFGSTGDIPVAGDWDGDGKADVGVYRSGTEANQQGYFYYRPSSQPNLTFISYPWGITGDKPVIADYDGDGKADPAVFRPSTGGWFVQRSRDGFYAIQFGAAEDKPVVGDYDGDGKADQAVFRPSNGVWYIWNSTAGFSAAQFGISTDKPVPANYDGDGKTDIAVYRDGNWFILNSTSGFTALEFGNSTDKSIPNVFVP
jgi:hypothetical protein